MDLNILNEGLKYAGFEELNDTQTDQFRTFYELLIETNKSMNLTAITDSIDVQQKHFLDSLMCLKTGLFKNSQSILDLGTGAGFPGIPLKIYRPDLSLTLVDSLNKRIIFLKKVIEILELKNIQVYHGRAEDLARTAEHREKYDLCVSRAVSNLSTLSEYCIPFVKRNGYFIAYKSGNVDPEIMESGKAIKMLGGQLENTMYFTIPGTEIERSLVIIKKENLTSNRYPRKAGTPQKDPLR